jgi:LysM repeat protein
MHRFPRRIVLMLSFVLLLYGVVAPLPALAHDRVHVVQPGETLSDIAVRYGTDVATLRQLNNLSDIDFVWSGQQLVLPEDPSTSGDSQEPASATSSHIVQPGDTLIGISVAHKIGLAQLLELNQISPAQRLYVGQKLLLPSSSQVREQAQEEDQNTPSVSENESATRIHIVQRGDYLGAIAKQYKTTPQAIIAANDLANPSLLVPGQKLIIAPPGLVEKSAYAPVDKAGYHVHTEFPTTTEKWIDVDLSEQRVVAYEGTRPVRAFIVSTGLPGTPTVTGTFRIWAKTPLQDMYGGNRAAGDYYYLKDVPWVQYFYEDYAFHGTYWHNNFGQPMSRGCVNMTNEDAKWLFEWADPTMNRSGWLFSDDNNPGTLVLVHQ